MKFKQDVPHVTFGAMIKRRDDFFNEHPEWRQMALDTVNTWNSGDVMLAGAIGEALMAAYEMGVAGTPPPIPAVKKAWNWRDDDTEKPTRTVRTPPPHPTRRITRTR